MLHLCFPPGTDRNRLTLPPSHCARPARAPHSIHRHPWPVRMPRSPSHFPEQGTELQVLQRHLKKPLTRAALQSPGLGSQCLTFLFLEICTAILPPRAAERKGSGSWAEVGIKGRGMTTKNRDVDTCGASWEMYFLLSEDGSEKGKSKEGTYKQKRQQQINQNFGIAAELRVQFSLL